MSLKPSRTGSRSIHERDVGRAASRSWRAIILAIVASAAYASAAPAQQTSPQHAIPSRAAPNPDSVSLSGTFGRRPPATRSIAVDVRAARVLDLDVGSRVRLSAQPDAAGDSVVVSAVTTSRADPAEVARQELHVRLHLDHLQSLMALDDRVDRFAIATRSGATDSVIAAVNHVAFGFRAHRSKDVAVGSSRTFRVVERFHRAIAIITVVASAAFLLCLLLLTVEERRRDIAALRMTGLSRRSIVWAIVIEAAIVSLLGCAIGVVVGMIASRFVSAHFQAVYQTPLAFAIVTPDIVLFATGLSLALGISAGAVAAWRLVRVPPLTLLGR